MKLYLSTFREITPDISNFNKATVLDDDVAVAVHVLNLLLNKNGFSYPNYPGFSFDITKYRYETKSELGRITNDIVIACDKFFGEFVDVQVDLTTRQSDRGEQLFVRLSLDFDIAKRDHVFPLADLIIENKTIEIVYSIHKSNTSDEVETQIYLN